MNLHEEIQRIKEVMQVDEMAYPTNFDFEKFRSINSFVGRIKYAKEMLLGRVGSGSGRAVFRIDDEKVLKVALNGKGVQQNSTEAGAYKQDYDAVARVFDYDQEGTWIEMELAKKINASRFQQLVGVTLEEMVTWLGYTTGKILYKPRQERLRDLRKNEFAENIGRFASDFDYPVPGDFAKINSYGEVLRDGRPTVVVIDFGYDSATDDMYATAKKKSRQRYDNRY